MRTRLLLSMAILPLAACSGNTGNSSAPAGGNSASGTGTGTSATVAPAIVSGGAINIQPGQWESRATLEEFDMPGSPPGMIDQMKQQVAARAERMCFTPEDVANMGRRMFEANNEGMNCQFSNQAFANGNIDMAGTCSGNGGTVEMTMQGTYTPTTMDTRSVVNTTAAGQTMRMVVTGNARRIGDCPAGEPAGTPEE